MKIDPNAPAFAAATCGDWNQGISIRAHFASIAMQGMLANHDLVRVAEAVCRKQSLIASDFIAVLAVIQSDALINELNK